jgi:hypothetical protein
MKRIHLALAVVIAAPHVMAVGPGLYNLLDESDPKPFPDRVGRVTISSQSNDNTRYYLAIPAATSFSLPCTQIGLIIGGKTIRFNSQGLSKSGGYSSMETQIEGRELARRVAEFFHVDVIERKHPGHRMLVAFLCDKKEFPAGGPVTVKLHISNVGDTAFAFIQGGRQRGPRDNQFAFSAELVGGKMVPDSGDPRNMGGIGIPVTLDPGQSHDVPVDLTNWFHFQPGGMYNIRGSYHMDFVDPRAHDLRTIWEDYACAEFTVEVGS